jgi:MraZ protein
MSSYLFSGSYDHSVDSKGRVIIPAPFRDALGEDFTITINPNRTAIAIYPKAVWEQQLEKLSRINPMDRKGIQYERYLMSMSYSGNTVDNQGRVVVPFKLRQKLDISKDIVFVGLNNYIEIWDEKAYQQVEADVEADFDHLVDYVFETYGGVT